jgi:hypothetical protein
MDCTVVKKTNVTDLEGVLEPLLLPLPVSDHFLRAVGMKFRP